MITVMYTPQTHLPHQGLLNPSPPSIHRTITGPLWQGWGTYGPPNAVNFMRVKSTFVLLGLLIGTGNVSRIWIVFDMGVSVHVLQQSLLHAGEWFVQKHISA